MGWGGVGVPKLRRAPPRDGLLLPGVGKGGLKWGADREGGIFLVNFGGRGCGREGGISREGAPSIKAFQREGHK